MKLCPKCDSPIDGANVYCRHCYAHYKRSLIGLDPEVKKRQRAREKANKAYLNGLIFKHNCALCGNSETEMHHPDYNKPLDVVWLCEPCHIELHIIERKALCA